MTLLFPLLAHRRLRADWIMLRGQRVSVAFASRHAAMIRIGCDAARWRREGGMMTPAVFRAFAAVLLAASTSMLIHDATAQSSAAASSTVASAPPISDCDDTNPLVHPGVAEVLGNRIDDDCDGLADEAPDGTPSNDVLDMDSDGVSVAAGDCNDTNPNVHVGLTETVGDRIDNDCDGLADEDAQNHPSTDLIDQDGDTFLMSNDRLFYGGFQA